MGICGGRWAEIKTARREGVAQAGTSRGGDDRICCVYGRVGERAQGPEGWSKDGDRVYGGSGAGDMCIIQGAHA